MLNETPADEPSAGFTETTCAWAAVATKQRTTAKTRIRRSFRPALGRMASATPGQGGRPRAGALPKCTRAIGRGHRPGCSAAGEVGREEVEDVLNADDAGVVEVDLA